MNIKKKEKKEDKYIYIVDLGATKKQLVKMNPNNEVNFKLTLNKKELENINSFENKLKDILKKTTI